MSDELLNRVYDSNPDVPSEPVEEEKIYDEETISMMINIVGEHLDYEKAGRVLAREHPRLFIKMLQGTLPTKGWAARFEGMNKVQAIKLYRAETGAGLKESKLFVERVGGYDGHDPYALGNSPFDNGED